LVQRVEFAEGRDMKQPVAHQHHITLKGALIGDQLANAVSQAGIADLNPIYPTSEGV
jgi:hypothetical protein